MTVIELVLPLAAILGAAILFTNAVEIMGDRLNLGAGAVGSLLAAGGTGRPETTLQRVALPSPTAARILGARLTLGAGAVGSLLAAVGTALPETMIPIVAILGALIVGSGGAAAGEIGIGAILGAPFLLATIALFVVGLAALGYRRRRSTGSEITADRQVTIPDMAFFLVCFGLAAGAGLVSLPLVLKIF